MDEWDKFLLENEIKTLSKRYNEMYSQAYKELRQKLEKATKSYARNNLNMRAKWNSGEITKEQYEDWLNGQAFIQDKWRNLSERIAEDLTHANEIAVQLVNDKMPTVYANGHNYMSYNISKDADMLLQFDLYNKESVERLMKENPNFLPPRKLEIPKDLIWNKTKINNALIQGILQGESVLHLAKRMREITNQNYGASLRTARTSLGGAVSAGTLDSMKKAKEMNIRLRKKWLSTLDNRTRNTHAHLDNETVDVDAPFSNGLMYPCDPNGRPSEVYNCRCTMISDIEGVDEVDPVYRLDNSTGKAVKDMTYTEWANALQSVEDTVVINQVTIGQAKTTQQITNMMNTAKWFLPDSPCDLNGVDLHSAKSICSSYYQVFEKYPQIKGQIGGVSAVDLSESTYAQCFVYDDGRVQVNKNLFKDFEEVSRNYDRDVLFGFHPKGTTAESIVVHEIGHAIDMYLSSRGIKFGNKTTEKYNPSNKLSHLLQSKMCMSAGIKKSQIGNSVSIYATRKPEEWFAECFAEYTTSAEPRAIAAKFGQMLEKIMEDVK